MSLLRMIGNIFGFGNKLRAQESMILGLVLNELVEEKRVNFDRQISSVKKVQRLFGGKEVDFYYKNRNDINPISAYLKNVSEYRYAQILWKQNSKKKNSSDIIFVDGVLFSIQSNFELYKFDNLVPLSVNVFEPNELQEVNAEPEAGMKILKTLHLDNYYVNNIRNPICSASISEWMNTNRCNLPADYVQLIAFSDGFQVGELKVFGIRELRRIAVGDEFYYVLAVKNDAFPVLLANEVGVCCLMLGEDQIACDPIDCIPTLERLVKENFD